MAIFLNNKMDGWKKKKKREEKREETERLDNSGNTTEI